MMSHIYDVIWFSSGQNRILQPTFSQIKSNKPAFHVKSKFLLFMSHDYDVIGCRNGQNRIPRPKFSRTEYDKAILHVK